MEYRMLNYMEIVQEGDEKRSKGFHNKDAWKPVGKGEIGEEFLNYSLEVRRPIIDRKEKADMKGKFIIGSINSSGEFSVARNPKKHENIIAAQNEAERLNKEFRDKRFVVLEIKGVCKAVEVCWE